MSSFLLLLAGTVSELTGVTADVAGTPLGSCTVLAFNTATKVLVRQTVSDAVTGAYSMLLPHGATYFLVAYKAGSPDVSGTTVNTITV